MRIIFQLVVILCVLTLFGVAKLRFEDQLNQDLVEAQLVQPPLKKGTSLQLGQTSAAVVLGGLRSLVASVWNLRAFHHFENLDWLKLEDSYEIITTLQPQTTHYWDTGAWHLHTNASVYFKEDKDLSSFRRSQMRKKYINKGAALLEEGIRQNPDNWRLHNSLARVWSDHHKLPDLKRALKHYEDTLACKSLPEYKRNQFRRFTFYTMARVEGREQDAYDLGRSLFNESDRNQLPNLVSCLFALQNALDIPEANRIPDSTLFPSEKEQLTWLKNYFPFQSRDFPINGIQAKIIELEFKFNPDL